MIMSLLIELPPDLERDLAGRAAELHLPLAEYAMRVLAGAGITSPKLATGAELVAYWKAEGLIGTKPEIADAPEHARMLRREAERRTR
jgi:hypothetical protein